MPKSVKFAAPHLLQARLQLWRSRFHVRPAVRGVLGALHQGVLPADGSKPFLQAQGAQRYEKTMSCRPTGGRILDRHGVVLASSLPARSIWPTPTAWTCPTRA